MLIATITALIFLFSGGMETFFVENLEKGIKKHIEDKDRRNEILVEVKAAKSYAKTHNKNRKQTFKDFEAVYVNVNSTEEDLTAFLDGYMEQLKVFQKDFMGYRMEIKEELSAEEWTAIMEDAKAAELKAVEKMEKKKKKEKEYFKKTRSVLEKLEDQGERQIITEQLDQMSEQKDKLIAEINQTSVLKSEALANQETDLEALVAIYDQMNKERLSAFEELIEFHKKTVTVCEKEQAEKVLAAFYKDLSLTSM